MTNKLTHLFERFCSLPKSLTPPPEAVEGQVYERIDGENASTLLYYRNGTWVELKSTFERQYTLSDILAFVEAALEATGAGGTTDTSSLYVCGARDMHANLLKLFNEDQADKDTGHKTPG